MTVDVRGHLIADPAKLTVNISFQLYLITSYCYILSQINTAHLTHLFRRKSIKPGLKKLQFHKVLALRTKSFTEGLT